MYELSVFHPRDTFPVERLPLNRASAVLEMIPELLARHAECDRIDVYCFGSLLFTVECAGNRIAAQASDLTEV
jgi:hypothetical protein